MVVVIMVVVIMEVAKMEVVEMVAPGEIQAEIQAAGAVGSLASSCFSQVCKTPVQCAEL